jgi:hypothetical protein
MHQYRIEDYREVPGLELSLTLDALCTQKSKEAGKADLIKLARTISEEPNWIFVPETSMWYNNTAAVSIDPQDGNRPISYGFIPIGFEHVARQAELYHTHPRAFLPVDLQAQTGHYEAQIAAETDEHEKHVLRIARALGIHQISAIMSMPSVDDVDSLFNFQIGYPSIDMSMGIVSDLGVATLRIGDPRILRIPSAAVQFYSTMLRTDTQDMMAHYALEQSQRDPVLRVTGRPGIQGGAKNMIAHLNSKLNPAFELGFEPIEEEK